MLRQKDKYIPRFIEKALKNSLKYFPALALSGPRQSGKSTLVKHIFSKTHTFISFDDPVTREMAISDPRLFLETCGEKIILDEIQYVPELLAYIKILIDNRRQKMGRFVITGSQQFNLIKNIGDTLAGRIALFDLLPFSIEEKGEGSFLSKILSSAEGCFIHSCLRGSFPEVTIQANIDARTWYGSYLQTYLERDIRTIYDVGILREFQQFLRLLAARTAQILNLSSLASDLGVSVNTIKKWLSILEASRIVYLLAPYYRNLGKRISKSPKIYFLDLGLTCYLTGISNKESLLGGPLSGALFENFIIQETLKYFFNRGISPNLFYLRTHNNLEIDLIIENNLELYPFEIKLTKTPNIRMADSIERCKKIFSKLKINTGRIISLAQNDINLTKNVSVMGLNSYLRYLKRFI